MGLFIETDKEWHRGIEISEYKGKIQLVQARQWQGEIKQSWADQEVGKDKKMRLPVSVTLGASKEDAIANLYLMLQELNGGVKVDGDPSFDSGSDVPF